MKKKIKEIPAIECEFIYGKDPLYIEKSVDGKTVKIIPFFDVRGLYPILKADGSIGFFDENAIEKVFTEKDFILSETQDYNSLYSQNLRPYPSSIDSKSNSIGCIRNGFREKMGTCYLVFDVFVGFAGYAFNLSH